MSHNAVTVSVDQKDVPLVQMLLKYLHMVRGSRVTGELALKFKLKEGGVTEKSGSVCSHE